MNKPISCFLVLLILSSVSCAPRPNPAKVHEEAVALLKNPSDPASLAQAVVLLEKNATLGYPPSESSLAVLYASGKGVQKDSEKSLALLRKAAEAGFDKAQHNLGLTLMKQNPATTAEALGWLEKAAAQGFLPSQKELAEIFYFGAEDVKMDKAKAKQWALLAANQGDADSQNMMGILTRDNPPESALWFEKAAKAGHIKAQASLGMALISVKNSPGDKKDGLAWLMISSEKGEPLAANFLKEYLSTQSQEELADAAKRKAEILSSILPAQK